MKAYRLLEYDGPEEWLEMTLARSIRGSLPVGNDRRISEVAVTFGSKTIPEALEEMLVITKRESNA